MKIFVLVSLAAFGGLAACNYIGDDNGCVVGFDDQKPQKDCRFGTPPVATSTGGCTTIAVDKAGADCKSVTWTTTIWPAMKVSCAASNCHDNGSGTFATGAKVYLSRDKAADAFNTLAKYKVGNCGTYVSSDKPETSQILNNLAGTAGTKMPLGPPLDPEVIKKIETWVKCGAVLQ